MTGTNWFLQSQNVFIHRNNQKKDPQNHSNLGVRGQTKRCSLKSQDCCMFFVTVVFSLVWWWRMVSFSPLAKHGRGYFTLKCKLNALHTLFNWVKMLLFSILRAQFIILHSVSVLDLKKANLKLRNCVQVHSAVWDQSWLLRPT